MSDSKKKNQSEDPIAALLAELNLTEDERAAYAENSEEGLELSESSTVSHSVHDLDDEESDLGLLDIDFGGNESSKENSLELNNDFEIKLTDMPEVPNLVDENIITEPLSEDGQFNHISAEVNEQFKTLQEASQKSHEVENHLSVVGSESSYSDKTVAISHTQNTSTGYGTGDRTVAVAGYSNRSSQGSDDNVKISVGQSGGGSSGYGGWGSTDSNLAQAENLKMAQSKILELERENEKIRHQNEELVSASEIIKERSDLLTAQVYEYKNDREDLESSFKNELALIKSQLNRKDAELQKAQMKIEELDSRLKFDMKKIRIRERELENRLELVRAEKNALVRSKDEQILESRRKLDQLQLEVDSFRQKCVELNRVIETNQDSFKRTTRALRLAMANLELQEENKMPLKKVD